MASFGGVNLFGAAVTMTTHNAPRSFQRNTYFGLDGLEIIDGGSRGGTTLVEGILVADSPAALATQESTIRSMIDGQSRDLVDTMGCTWPNVLMLQYQPTGRIQFTLQSQYFRRYQIQMLHLS